MPSTPRRLFAAALPLLFACAPADGAPDASDDASDAAQAACTGTATPCAERTSGQCLTAHGCGLSLTQGACDKVPCPAGVACERPSDCGTELNANDCQARAGCEWTAECEGTATTCAETSAEDCAQNAGCSEPR